MRRHGLRFDDVVVVAGLGAIGMGILQVAHLKTPRALVGLDVDATIVAYAKKKYGDQYFQHYDGEHIPYEDKTFDASFEFRAEFFDESERILTVAILFLQPAFLTNSRPEPSEQLTSHIR